MSFRIALISLWLGTFAFADECAELHASLLLTKSKLADLQTLEAELEEKYHKYVTEDFVSQMEGSLDSLSHGSALKVAFARKRLRAAIQEKRTAEETSRKAYCGKCASGKPELCAENGAPAQ